MATWAICCAMLESFLAIGLSPVAYGCPARPQAKKMPAWSNTSKVFDHAGLLVNEPPGEAGLPFIQSSDDIRLDCDLRRWPVPTDPVSSSIVPRRAGIARELF